MSELPSVEKYKKKIAERAFQAYKCMDCGAVIAPPLGVCYACGGSKMTWTSVSGKGKLVSFTVIHVAPDEFVAEAPYFVAIVELDEGARVAARLAGFDPLKPQEVKLGTRLVLDYVQGKSGKTYLAFRPA
ncbi:MAG: OB-fold domain-containing protein [Candidatus Thorarchaeota archaeon]|nr:OB-fold domain-containing protein [Candidatus Thorarchaeota archaeon]